MAARYRIDPGKLTVVLKKFEPEAIPVNLVYVRERRPTAKLRAFVGRLRHPYLVLGNHDYAISRDPFSRKVEPSDVGEGTLLLDTSVEVSLRGRRVEIAGVDARTMMDGRRSVFPPADADLRILLCHFPAVLDTVPPGRWQLILGGHLHAGQIVLPYGRGKIPLAHPSARYADRAVYEKDGTVLHVSPGLGTTFVPFRFFARPEATELVLRAPTM